MLLTLLQIFSIGEKQIFRLFEVFVFSSSLDVYRWKLIFHITKKTSALRNRPPIFNTNQHWETIKLPSPGGGWTSCKEPLFQDPIQLTEPKICIYKIQAYTKKGKMIYKNKSTTRTILGKMVNSFSPHFPSQCCIANLHHSCSPKRHHLHKHRARLIPIIAWLECINS